MVAEKKTKEKEKRRKRAEVRLREKKSFSSRLSSMVTASRPGSLEPQRSRDARRDGGGGTVRGALRCGGVARSKERKKKKKKTTTTKTFFVNVRKGKHKHRPANQINQQQITRNLTNINEFEQENPTGNAKQKQWKEAKNERKI